MLKKRENSKKPWFTTFLTLSSHEPFEVPYKKFEDAHFNAFAYTDHCIGEFIRRFRKTKQWKNTLIVLLPDHGIPYPKEGERFSPRFFRIPMIWTGGAVRQKMTVEKIMNQTDLAATLLAQLGLKHDNFLFSRNVLSESYTYPFAFYSFVNGFCFLDNTGVSVLRQRLEQGVLQRGSRGRQRARAEGKGHLADALRRGGTDEQQAL